MDLVIQFLDPLVLDSVYGMTGIPALLDQTNWIRQAITIWVVFLVVRSSSNNTIQTQMATHSNSHLSFYTAREAIFCT
jgi:hypothetical protein